jgi:hypothetical protein
MISLIDTFNDVVISRHRDIENAIKAKHKHIKAIQKYNGKDSYLTYSIKDSSGKKVSNFDIESAELSLLNLG